MTNVADIKGFTQHRNVARACGNTGSNLSNLIAFRLAAMPHATQLVEDWGIHPTSQGGNGLRQHRQQSESQNSSRILSATTCCDDQCSRHRGLQIEGFAEHPKVANACGNTGNNLSQGVDRNFFPL